MEIPHPLKSIDYVYIILRLTNPAILTAAVEVFWEVIIDFALFFFCGFCSLSPQCFIPFLFSSLCLLSLVFFFNEVVCLACFRYFLDSLFLFLNSRLIFAHISVQCAFLQ